MWLLQGRSMGTWEYAGLQQTGGDARSQAECMVMFSSGQSQANVWSWATGESFLWARGRGWMWQAGLKVSWHTAWQTPASRHQLNVKCLDASS